MFLKRTIIKLLSFLSIAIIMFSCASSKDETTPNFREAFIGQFAMAETCGSFTDTYTITNSATDVENQIQIANFHSLFNIKATATSETKLSIPEQVVASSGVTEYTVSGSGTLASGQLTLNFTILRSGNSTQTSCAAIGNKQ